MAKKRPMKLVDLFKLKAVGAVAISPDGTKVAFELKRFDLQENKNFVNIMLVDVGGQKPRPLTCGNHVDLRPRWSPDGKRLAFTSDRDKGRTLWLLDMTGGEPRRISEPDGFVTDFAFSPNGRKIVYTRQAMSENESEQVEAETPETEVSEAPAAAKREATGARKTLTCSMPGMT